MIYIKYNPNNGRILSVNQSPQEFIDTGAIDILIPTFEVDDLLHYVNVVSKEIKRKKDYTIGNLPVPCAIEIEGQNYEVTEQPEFEFDTPGVYTLRVIPESPQYLEKEFEYVVEA